MRNLGAVSPGGISGYKTLRSDFEQQQWIQYFNPSWLGWWDWWPDLCGSTKHLPRGLNEVWPFTRNLPLMLSRSRSDVMLEKVEIVWTFTSKFGKRVLVQESELQYHLWVIVCFQDLTVLYGFQLVQPALWCSGIADGLRAWRWQLAAVRLPPGPGRESWRGTQTKAQCNAATGPCWPKGARNKKYTVFSSCINCDVTWSQLAF